MWYGIRYTIDKNEGLIQLLHKRKDSELKFLLHILDRDKVDYAITNEGVLTVPDHINLAELAEDILCEEQGSPQKPRFRYIRKRPWKTVKSLHDCRSIMDGRASTYRKRTRKLAGQRV